ncbi:hypothetical protein N7523_010246 [Penicillium sp. IBT 18751x]|nr:hypothetical protein N7523_010246 [Penicillium sp. IBT 18751x]
MYKYEMERTEIRDRDWMRHIPPVCSDIQSILNIRNQENPTRRLYNYFNIQDIIGVAVPYNANDQANGAHSSETTLKCLKLTGLDAKKRDLQHDYHEDET